MFDDTENEAAPDTAPTEENAPAAEVAQEEAMVVEPEWSQTWENPTAEAIASPPTSKLVSKVEIHAEGEPKYTALGFPVSTVPIEGPSDKHDFIRMCINMGLNGVEIGKLSLSTPWQMKRHQQVYDGIQSCNLVRLWSSPRVKRRRIGPHNEHIIESFTRVYGQLQELGFEVDEVIRDEAPHPRARFRTDWGLRARIHDNTYRVFWEEQVSKLEYSRWATKMRNYVKLYEMYGEPFRVVIRLQREYDLSRVRSHARDILSKDHPNLNLFYFISVGQFRHVWNVVTDRIYLGAWNPDEKFALMPALP